MKRISKLFLGLTLIAAVGFTGCGGGGGGTGSTTVDVNNLDGTTGVPVNASLKYTFNSPVNTSSVTTGSYFLHPTTGGATSSVKRAYDPAICNSASAIAANITCALSDCTLDPSSDLEGGTNYTICLGTSILYLTGSGFEGFLAQFTTAGSVVAIESAKLVRLDGTELEFSAQPIPRRVGIKYTLSAALTEEADRAAFEAALKLEDPDGAAVAGTYTWSSDYTTATFNPSHNLKYKTEYDVAIDETAIGNLSKSIDPTTLHFTTLTQNDINGDGYADILVGGYAYNGPLGPNQGIAYIFHGSSSGIATNDMSSGGTANTTFLGGATEDYFAYSLGMAGDLNADGYFDVIIGSYAAKVGIDVTGQTYVFYGSASGISDCNIADSCADNTITGPSAAHLGYFVSLAGDVNGDGFDDIILGTESDDAYVFHGSALGISDCNMSAGCSAASSLIGIAFSCFGKSVAYAGDTNGDGYDDVLIGAYNSDVGAINAGQAYVFNGSDSGIGNHDLESGDTADATITGAAMNFQTGDSIAPAGDINGDGYDDVLIGAWAAKIAGNLYGQTYVFLGSASGIGDCALSGSCTNLNATLTGSKDSGYFSSGLYTAGDVNGDGYDDIVVGEKNAIEGLDEPGKAYFWYGSADGLHDCALYSGCTPSATVVGVIDPNTDDPDTGDSLVLAGDINGDGYDDVLVGAPRYFYDGIADAYKGRVYIFNGSGTGIDAASPATLLTGPISSELGRLR